MSGPTGPSPTLAVARADWVRSHDFDWFVTGTFRTQVSMETCQKTVQAVLRAAARENGQHLVYVLGAGEGHVGGLVHVHLLLRSDRVGVPWQGVARHWDSHGSSTGRIHIDPYDRDRGAAHYLANHRVFDVQVACPRWASCRRRNGCVYKLDWP